jgi:hypothetical protein
LPVSKKKKKLGSVLKYDLSKLHNWIVNYVTILFTCFVILATKRVLLPFRSDLGTLEAWIQLILRDVVQAYQIKQTT